MQFVTGVHYLFILALLHISKIKLKRQGSEQVAQTRAEHETQSVKMVWVNKKQDFKGFRYVSF